MCSNLVFILALLFITGVATAGPAEYVGRAACKECHAKQNSLWTGSHHDLAMQVATKATVYGDFENEKLIHFGAVYKFYQQGEKFYVRTDGPDGNSHDYHITYTFGAYPLQQYLIEFPGGRLQALDVAWDSRPKKQGGQRWFHLRPGETIQHDDVLHWTGPNMNWNYMCADCHSTNLKKNYDEDNASYQTSWSEIDVSCEACHGPGSKHIHWAKVGKNNEAKDDVEKGLMILFDERKDVIWSIDKKTGNPHRSMPRETNKEIDVCAQCHSRRSQFSDNYEPGKPLLDSYYPAHLTASLYYADGQVLGETYVYGSFLQSKMYHMGVTCSDCHDVHTANVKLPGDQVCYQCHEQQKHASQKHHFHAQDTSGASCIECHMPASNQMIIDARHDHSFRIPRPDLSVEIGTPNACNKCHTEQTALWARDKAALWYGKQSQGFQQYARALDTSRRELPNTAKSLQALVTDQEQPVIARATALSELGAYPDQKSLELIQLGIKAGEPLLRIAALKALEYFGLQQRMFAFPLINDDVRAVRIEVARLLASFPKSRLSETAWKLLEEVIEEYIMVQTFNADRPESQVNLGNLYTDLNEHMKAESAYRKALSLQPQYTPAYVNLAQLLIKSKKEKEAEGLLKKGIKFNPKNPGLHYAFGLYLVQQKRYKEALSHLSSATELSPESATYSYTYAVALQSQDKVDASLRVLEAAWLRHPNSIDILYALTLYNWDAGNAEKAHHYAKKLQELLPHNHEIKKIIQKFNQP